MTSCLNIRVRQCAALASWALKARVWTGCAHFAVNPAWPRPRSRPRACFSRGAWAPQRVSRSWGARRGAAVSTARPIAVPSSPHCWRRSRQRRRPSQSPPRRAASTRRARAETSTVQPIASPSLGGTTTGKPIAAVTSLDEGYRRVTSPRPSDPLPGVRGTPSLNFGQGTCYARAASSVSARILTIPQLA